jgi:hypothetical protein
MTDERIEEAPVEQTALAVRPKAQLQAVDTGVLPIIPSNIEEAQRYASGLIAANQVPDAFRYRKDEFELGTGNTIRKKGEPNAPLLLMGILKCLEIGVPPQTGLSGLLPLNGRFDVWGDLAAALVQRSGKVARQTERRIGPSFDPGTPLGEWPDDYGWEVRYWRVGQEEPYVGTFTIREARRAGLWMQSNKETWIKYPDDMLRHRARGRVFKVGFADGLHGMSIADDPTLPPEPEDGGVLVSRHRSALDDEPVTELPKPEETVEPTEADLSPEF